MAAALDISAAVAHIFAGDKAHSAGRFARAAEKFALAAEVARAGGLGAPDCLVVVNAQSREAYSLTSTAMNERPDRALALYRRTFTELLPALMTVLERRRLADTLLYGKCAPHEVEYHRQVLAIYPGNASIPMLAAPFIGYDAYLKAAALALLWLCLWPNSPPPPPPTAAQKEHILRFAQTALELMSAPRLHEHLSMNAEAVLVKEVRRMMDLVHMSHNRRFALCTALDSLKDSGTITRRTMEGCIPASDRKFEHALAKAEADKEAFGLRSCAHCGAAEVHVKQFKRCSACNGVVFCCKDCQLANWPAHKAACKAARKAAAGGAADA